MSNIRSFHLLTAVARTATPDLGPTGRCVLLQIAALHGTGYRPALAELAELVGLGRRGLLKVLAILERNGFIERELRPGGRTGYRIATDRFPIAARLAAVPAVPDAARRRRAAPPVVVETTPGGVNHRTPPGEPQDTPYQKGSEGGAAAPSGAAAAPPAPTRARAPDPTELVCEDLSGRRAAASAILAATFGSRAVNGWLDVAPPIAENRFKKGGVL